jgi:hypothetical protein
MGGENVTQRKNRFQVAEWFHINETKKIIHKLTDAVNDLVEDGSIWVTKSVVAKERWAYRRVCTTWQIFHVLNLPRIPAILLFCVYQVVFLINWPSLHRLRDALKPNSINIVAAPAAVRRLADCIEQLRTKPLLRRLNFGDTHQILSWIFLESPNKLLLIHRKCKFR